MLDTKNLETKTLVVMKGQHRCLVIDEGSDKHPSYRLPTLNELSATALTKAEKMNLGENLVLLLTREEVSPWDVLDPFPPAHYYDYGYMNLMNLEETNQYWNNLKEEDKKVIGQDSYDQLLKSAL